MDYESKATVLFIYAETPLHPGSGSGLGVIDLPIQRERLTEYPIIQASSVKGVLRSEATRRQGERSPEIAIVFGPEGDRASEHAGALVVSDARILLFPVRSRRGVFAWVTSPSVLARFKRDLATAGIPLKEADVGTPSEGQAFVSRGCRCCENGKLGLEEYEFEASQDHDNLTELGTRLANAALPPTEEFAWWREKLETDIVVLRDEDYQDFVGFATEVVARTKLDYGTKTVSPGALWYQEFLPAETLMYSVVLAQTPRKQNDSLQNSAYVLEWLRNLNIRSAQIGGDETVGKGLCSLRFLENA